MNNGKGKKNPVSFIFVQVSDENVWKTVRKKAISKKKKQ